MSIEHVIASLVVLLLLAVLAEPLSRAVRLPYSSVLVVTGFVMSELVVMSGIDTGLRAESFHDLVFYVFIPVLVFESAYRINKRLLLENLVPVIVLAVIGLSLTASITARGIYYGIAHPVDLRSQTVMVWGGLRGAVALALALSLPVTLDYWWTIQSIAFGVVLFTLFVQAPTIGLLVDRLAVRDRA